MYFMWWNTKWAAGCDLKRPFWRIFNCCPPKCSWLVYWWSSEVDLIRQQCSLTNLSRSFARTKELLLGPRWRWIRKSTRFTPLRPRRDPWSFLVLTSPTSTTPVCLACPSKGNLVLCVEIYASLPFSIFRSIFNRGSTSGIKQENQFKPTWYSFFL
jgi:hypothetical protein